MKYLGHNIYHTCSKTFAYKVYYRFDFLKCLLFSFPNNLNDVTMKSFGFKYGVLGHRYIFVLYPIAQHQNVWVKMFTCSIQQILIGCSVTCWNETPSSSSRRGFPVYSVINTVKYFRGLLLVRKRHEKKTTRIVFLYNIPTHR